MVPDANEGQLVLVGAVPVDLVFRVPRLPASGEDILASRGEYFVGGGFIVLFAAHQAGVRSRFGGRIGQGPSADRIRKALADIGCPALQPEIADQDSTLVLVFVEPNGERTFITSHNPELNIEEQDLARIDVGDRDVVYVSGYEFTERKRVEAIAAWLHAHGDSGSAVVCDLGPYGAHAGMDSLTDLVRAVDWLCMNATEAMQFTGTQSVKSAVARLGALCADVGLIIRAGSSGAIVKRPHQRAVGVPALAVDNVVDTNGAGDTHSGTFCAGLVKGLDPIEGVWLANCAAALSVTKFGSATAPLLAVSGHQAMPSLTDPW
jgi:sugar/nucleoside kinase (ribokinase family)